jgi:type II secretory pathway predicted ATPase ExeA
MLLNALAARLGADGVVVARPSAPGPEPLGVLRAVAAVFRVAAEDTRAALSEGIRRVLDEAAGDGRPVLVILDEAESLPRGALAEIPGLLDLGRLPGAGARAPFSVLLAGQDELHETLEGDDLAALAREVRLRCHLRPLTLAEVADFVQFQLQAAGLAPDAFAIDALEAIWAFSEGTPGLINLLCGRALAAWPPDAPQVSREIVGRCAEEFGGMPVRGERGSRRAGARRPLGPARASRRRLAVAGLATLAALGTWAAMHLARGPSAGPDADPAPGRAAPPEGRAAAPAEHPAAPEGPAAPAMPVAGGPIPDPARDSERATGDSGSATAQVPAAPSPPPPAAAPSSPPAGALATPPGPSPAARPAVTPSKASVTSPGGPAGGTAAPTERREPSEPDPSAIIDWLLRRGR